MRDILYQLLSKVPPDAECAIVIFPEGGKTRVQSFGMSFETLAKLLYEMADEVVDQKIPPPDWRQRIRE